MDERHYKLESQTCIEKLKKNEKFLLEIYHDDIFFEHKIYQIEEITENYIRCFELFTKIEKSFYTDKKVFKYTETNVNIVRLFNVYKYGVDILNNLDYKQLSPKTIDYILSVLGINRNLDKYGKQIQTYKKIRT